MTSRILVPFQGEGTGAGPMTWAQHSMWQTMQESGRSMNIGGALPLPPGTPLEAMTRTLQYLVSRHPALRTRLEFGGDGPPRQVVADAGEAVVEVVDVPAAGDAGAAAEELRRRYLDDRFDYAVEWPVRMAVVRCGPELTHVVLVYCHLAVDSFGIDELVRDLAHLGGPASPRDSLTPLAIAAGEQTPGGVRKSRKSLRYWEQQLLSLPAPRPGAPGDAREPRFWELTIRSPAIHRALRTVAHRTGFDSTFVALAAYTVARGRLAGGGPVAAQLVVNNRFRPGYADAVGLLVQNGLCVIDPAGEPFDELVRRAWNAATNAFAHGYYDPAGLAELLDRLPRDIAYLVNDRRGGTAAGATVPTADEVKAAVALTTSRWTRKIDRLTYTMIVNIDAAADGTDAVDVAVTADTHRIGPAGIEVFGRELEAVLVAAASEGEPNRAQ
ncbi:condensation protein [Dactylosporangium vinaceum]|uniref:Condensation domain-containing protein n=1 Tax=Dactylosporangium vinaceum TaxID=53362 RepID=A0ABV5MS45_9ACTN|nr:condensation domain-containing protein [Dactylosporangium vinaceum]UAC00247.1 condensation protein [Dactylosporangium vinaceum]